MTTAAGRERPDQGEGPRVGRSGRGEVAELTGLERARGARLRHEVRGLLRP